MLGNRDLLQRIIRLSLDGGPDADSPVPLHFEHAAAWGARLLVNRFWKVSALHVPCACPPDRHLVFAVLACIAVG